MGASKMNRSDMGSPAPEKARRETEFACAANAAMLNDYERVIWKTVFRRSPASIA
jgi:hypothetical protein